MRAYLDKILPVELSRIRRRKRDQKDTEREEKKYRRLAGTLMYMGNLVMPQAASITSRMQKQLGDLRVRHIIEGKNYVKDVLSMRSYRRLLRHSKLSNMRIF